MLELDRAVWLGGPSGSGKTTIARRLAIRHGLRYFGADKQSHLHHARALQLGLPAASEWESRSPDERWLDEPIAMTQLLVQINDERWPFFLDDIRTLPAFPGVIAEGTLIRPLLLVEAVGNCDGAAWIVPSPEAETRNLTERRAGAPILISSDPERAWTHRVQRELLLARQFAKEAKEVGARVVETVLDDTLQDVEAQVEAALSDAIANLPRASTTEERFQLRRWENERLARHIADAIAERPDLGTKQTRMTSFDCECGTTTVCDQVRMTIDDFRRTIRSGRVLAPGHEPK